MTETRVAALDGRSLWLFRLYWLAVGPFSALIRRRWLRAIARRATSVAVALVLSGQLALAAGSEKLTDSEWRQIDQSKVVVKTRAVVDYPWPEVTVYRRVAALPEEVMAIYADFESQAGYLPKVVESRIVKRESRNTFHVSYEYEVTGPNERYTVLAAVSRAPAGFQVTWDLVTARYAHRLSGQMKVEKVASGTIIEYVNRVDPGAFGRWLGSPETTATQVRETVEALAAHAERFRVEQPEELKTLTRALRAMLSESQ